MSLPTHAPDVAVRWIATLAHFLWQGTLVALAAAVAALPARGARTRYALHLGALALMAVLPCVTFAWLGSHAASQPRPATPSVVVAHVPPNVARHASPAVEAPAAPSQPAIRAMPIRGEPPLPAIASPILQSSPLQPNQGWRQFAPHLAVIYAAGVLFMLCRLMVGIAAARGLRRVAVPISDAHALQPFLRLCGQLRLSTCPGLAACTRAAVPLVVGVLRPMVLVPPSLLTGLTPQQLQAALAHELAHIRRLDPWANLLQRLIEAALFFHPAVWFISSRCRAERELCCDDLAAGCVGGATDYAQALVRIAEACRLAQAEIPGALALAAIDRVSRLRRRVLRLLRGEPRQALDLHAGPLAGFALMATVVIATITTFRHGNDVAAAAAPEPPAVVAAIEVFERQGVLDDPNYAWIASLRDLEQAGKSAVPALCRELHAGTRAFSQGASARALCLIGDRRAVPSLISALEQCIVRVSDYGFTVPDPELAAYYGVRALDSRTPPRPAMCGFGRPVREITGALESLTGHSEGYAHFDSCDEEPNDEGAAERDRLTIRAAAARWRGWWEANRASLLNEADLQAAEELDRPQPPSPHRTALTLDISREIDHASAAGASIEIWADREHALATADAAGRASLTLPWPAGSTSVIVRSPGCVPTRLWFGPNDKPPKHYDLTLRTSTHIGGVVVTTDGGKPIAGAQLSTVHAPRFADHEWANLVDLVATTGPDGHWWLDGVPAGFTGAFHVQQAAVLLPSLFGK